jgi:hypothetical protein
MLESKDDKALVESTVNPPKSEQLRSSISISDFRNPTEDCEYGLTLRRQRRRIDLDTVAYE